MIFTSTAKIRYHINLFGELTKCSETPPRPLTGGRGGDMDKSHQEVLHLHTMHTSATPYLAHEGKVWGFYLSMLWVFVSFVSLKSDLIFCYQYHISCMQYHVAMYSDLRRVTPYDVRHLSQHWFRVLPIRHQYNTRTNFTSLKIWAIMNKPVKFESKYKHFLFSKGHFKMLSAKCQPFYSDLTF